MFINGELPKDEKYPLSCVYWIHREGMSNPKTQGYVGVSSKGVDVRWIQHKSDAKLGSRCVVHNAMRKYEDVVIKELVTADPEFCLMVEESLRPTLRIGWNIRSGGTTDGLGREVSEETRRKLSESKVGKHTGRTVSEETRKKISKSKLGTKLSQEVRDEMSRQRLGKKPNLSVEQRQARADRARNRVITQEMKDKISLKLTGRQPSWKANNSSEAWKIACEVYDCVIVGMTTGQMSPKFGFSKDSLKTIVKKIKEGWQPKLDLEYLSWLTEQKEQHES